MKILTFDNYELLCADVTARIISTVKQKPSAVICIASGHTPAGVLNQLREKARQGVVNLHDCHFIGLDEWLGIGRDNPGSCRFLLDDQLFKPLGIADSQIHFYDGLTKDPQAECHKMDAAIAGLGGLDFLLLGIGMNGHIALNEPGSDWNLRCRVSELHETTVSVGQKYFASATALTQGITMGMQYLYEAKQTVLMASGTGKAAIVKAALEGPVTKDVPASIFQTLPDALVLLDSAAAGSLQRS